MILIPPLFVVWLITVLAETNRTPFDFAEGESELVSGFNIEYGAGPFAFIFIAEYTNILVIRALTGAIFRSFSFFWGFSPLVNSFLFIGVTIVVVWARATMPRIRYDRLIMLTWKSFLPFSIGLLIFRYRFIVFMV